MRVFHGFCCRFLCRASRAPRYSCSTCVGAIAARAHRTAFAHGIDRVRSGRCFLPRCPRTLLHLREHTCPFLRLPHDCGFFRLPFCGRAPPPTRPPPSSPPPRASPPLDCPILRPRAGLPLSRAYDSPFTMSFGATLRTRFPYPRGCWLLHVCVEILQAPFELAAACGLLSPRCLSLSSSLLFAG